MGLMEREAAEDGEAGHAAGAGGEGGAKEDVHFASGEEVGGDSGEVVVRAGDFLEEIDVGLMETAGAKFAGEGGWVFGGGDVEGEDGEGGGLLGEEAGRGGEEEEESEGGLERRGVTRAGGPAHRRGGSASRRPVTSFRNWAGV